MASHSLLRAFESNTPAFGVWVTLPGTFHARTVALASPHLSWITIDCEHGLIPLIPDAAATVSAVENVRKSPGDVPISTLVRIPATGVSNSSSWQIKYALDAGARGVVVPLISTAAKAKEVAADARFPPAGRRGFGSPFTHGTWGMTAKEYLTTANDSILVIVQIENQEAVQNADEIARVDGIDVLFIGPYDLSISLGLPTPNPDPHPDLEDIIQKVLKAAHAAGKKCGIYCSNGEQAARRAREGFDMINTANDVGSMTDGIAQRFATAVKL
jgi:4-hydroxy-2-oxoheptanedioate aldolase